jgi:DNA-binding MarR family transcriptional regulator
MLGLIDANPDCNTSTAIKMASTAMSINTAHRYITQLVERELIEQTINQYDRRYTALSITNIGREVLNEIEQSAMEHTDE